MSSGMLPSYIAFQMPMYMNMSTDGVADCNLPVHQSYNSCHSRLRLHGYTLLCVKLNKELS